MVVHAIALRTGPKKVWPAAPSGIVPAMESRSFSGAGGTHVVSIHMASRLASDSHPGLRAKAPGSLVCAVRPLMGIDTVCAISGIPTPRARMIAMVSLHRVSPHTQRVCGDTASLSHPIHNLFVFNRQ